MRQYGQTYALVTSGSANRGATSSMSGNSTASADSIGALFSTASSAVSAATTSQASVTAQRRKRLADDIVFFVTLNNLDVSCSNMRTLRLHLDTQFADIGKTDGKTMIAHCLDGISETAEQFAKAAQRGISMVIARLTPRVHQLLEPFAVTNYQIREADYADYDINDPFATSFIDALQPELLAIKLCVTDTHFMTLVTEIVQIVVTRFEALIMAKRFTFWGSMQLDRDRRRLSSFFASATPTMNHRDKFTRLEQLTSLLQLDRPAEVLDMWTEHHHDRAVWRLDSNDIRRILALRPDFLARDIAALKL